MGLDERFVVAGRAEIAPQRHAEGIVPVSRRAEGPAEARVGPVGDHGVAGPDLVLAPGVAIEHLGTGTAGEDLGAGPRPSDVAGGGRIEDGPDGLGPLPHDGARLGGPLGH